MVTRIHKANKGTLFLKEHRKAKGVTAEAMAGRLGLERESVHRLERFPGKLTWEKQVAYADALDIEPEDLRWPPGTRSVDAIVKNAPPEMRDAIADFALRLVAGRRS